MYIVAVSAVTCACEMCLSHIILNAQDKNLECHIYKCYNIYIYYVLLKITSRIYRGDMLNIHNNKITLTGRKYAVYYYIISYYVILHILCYHNKLLKSRFQVFILLVVVIVVVSFVFAWVPNTYNN